MAKVGRPSLYKQDYAKQAEKLCLLGATDQEIADFFELMPIEEDWLLVCLMLMRQDRSGVIADRKKARSSSRRKVLANNPSTRLRNATSARVWAALKGRSDGALFSRLGYSVNDLMRHLDIQFSAGMAWDNYGKWHVDHIRPCSSFDLTDSAQFAGCWALGNLQPLWAVENTRKGASNVPA